MFKFAIGVLVYQLEYILTHTKGERREGFKETNNGVYSKGPNSWIHSIDFKLL